MTDRIIPARAGFTSAGLIGQDAGTDHPRSRGVYRRGRLRIGGCRGSSPLARGLLVVVGDEVHVVGIIPARAGFTCG